MAEEAAAPSKSKTEYTAVTMTDGRTVQFAGKRKVMKDTILDSSKIIVDGDTVTLQAGAVNLRMDFVNGETRTIPLPLSLLARFAGHGAEQKFGDELASTADKPLTPEDMVCAIDDLNATIQKGEWGRGRESSGGSVSGASIVIQAILEAINARNERSGKPPTTLEKVKAFIQGRLDADKDLSRRALYDSFRAPGTETAAIIQRLEAEKLKKNAKVDANAELDKID